MKTTILQQAAGIFDTIEKWRAFYDMQQACPDIITHWRKIGAKALREEFGKNSGKWACSNWGGDADTKWYLTELGVGSISIGIGWDLFELHLFDGRNSDETWQKAADQLDSPEFRQLVSRIGPRCYRATWKSEKLLLADLEFDPLGSGADSGFRARLLAWHAAHTTEDFVKKTLERVRQLIEDEEVVQLIRDLNARSSASINL